MFGLCVAVQAVVSSHSFVSFVHYPSIPIFNSLRAGAGAGAATDAGGTAAGGTAASGGNGASLLSDTGADGGTSTRSPSGVWYAVCLCVIGCPLLQRSNNTMMTSL